MKPAHAPHPTGRRRAFTLIGLLVVVAIIAIISAVSIPAVPKIQDAKRKAAIRKEGSKSREDFSIGSSSNRPIFDRIDFDLQPS